VNRAKVIGITWPIAPEIDDAELERLLFTPAGFHEGPTKSLPDWAKVHEELKRRGVTLMILWEEHRAEYADGPAARQSKVTFSDNQPMHLMVEHASLGAAPVKPKPPEAVA
jgi:transposase